MHSSRAPALLVAVLLVASTLVGLSAPAFGATLTSPTVSTTSSLASTGGVRYNWGFTTGSSVTNLSRVTMSVPAGTHGANPYLLVNGVSGNYASTPDSTNNSIANDFDVRVKVALNQWSGASGSQTLMAKSDSMVSFRFSVNSSGYLVLENSANGTTLVTATSSVTTGATNGSQLWVRASKQVNDSGTQNKTWFYTSPDGVAWTQLGSIVIVSGVTSVYDSTDPVEVGGYLHGTANMTSGRIYHAELRSGNPGQLRNVFDPNDTVTGPWTSWASTTSGYGETWTTNRTGTALAPGADISSDLTVSAATGVPAGGTATLRYIDALAVYTCTATTVAASVASTLGLTGFTNTATPGSSTSTITTYSNTPAVGDSATTVASSSFNVVSSTSTSSWWDLRYGYRQKVTVANSTYALSSGYSLSFTFDHASLVSAGKSLSSGADVRVIYWTGSGWQELQRVLQPSAANYTSAWNTAATKVWFRSPAAISASATNTSYFVYFGNASALSAPYDAYAPADPNRVFDMWEDFSGAFFEYAKWGGGTTQPGTSTYISSGQLLITGTPQSGSEFNYTGVTTYPTYTSDWLMESSFSIGQQDSNEQQSWKGAGALGDARLTPHATGASTTRLQYYASGWQDVAGSVMTGNTFTSHRVAQALTAGGVARHWEDGSLVTSRTGVSTSAQSLQLNWSPNYLGGAFAVRYDDVFIRKYVATEPTVTLGPTAFATGYSATVLSNSPSMFLRLGESSGTTAVDASGNTDTGTYSGSPVYSRLGSNDTGDTSVVFHTGDSVNTATSFTGSNTMTAEVWFKTTATVGGRMIGFSNGGSSDRMIYMSDSGKVAFALYPGSSKVIASPLSYNDGNWHMAAATVSGAGQILYVDGAQVAIDAATTSGQAYTGTWRLGGYWGGYTPTQTSNYVGYLDEAAAWQSTALTASQILNHYEAARNAPIAVNATYAAAVQDALPNLYLGLNEPSGTSATDLSYYANTGTYGGSITLGAGGSNAGGGTTAATFHGNSDTITTPNLQNTPNSQGTSIELWFKTTTTTGGRMMGFQTGGSYDRHIWMSNDGKLHFGVYPTAYKIVNSASAYNDGSWHMVVATLGPAGEILYVDGTQVGIDATTTSGDTYTGSWTIGDQSSFSTNWTPAPTSRGFTGTMDEVAAWNTLQLPAATISAHYALGGDIAPTVPTALAQYQNNGSTSIPLGTAAPTSMVVFKALTHDADTTDMEYACVEVVPVGTAFTNVETKCESTSDTQGTTAQVIVTGLTAGVSYHWQLRSKDSYGQYSPWAQYGGNNDTVTADPDFYIDQLPTAPSAIEQYQSNGTTAVPINTWYSGTTMVFKGTVSDPDTTDTVYLCIEIKDINTAFTGTESCSTGVTPGAATSVTVSTGLVTGTQYHWQAHTKDLVGNYSATWTPYGANSDVVVAGRDFAIDTTLPTLGTVNDGVATDVAFNDGSLTSLKANWGGFGDTGSGITNYEYSIGTSPGGTTTKGWTSVGTSTSVTASSLSLSTLNTYYVNVRATDGAGNASATYASSNGQKVLPMLTFTVTALPTSSVCGSVTTNIATTTSALTFGLADSTKHQIAGQNLSVSTNASAGYTVFIGSPAGFTGARTGRSYVASTGTNAAPVTWPSNGTEAFGYTTQASNLSGTAARFQTSKWAQLATSGGEVMRNTGTAVSADTNCVAFQASSAATTPADSYVGVVTYSVVPTF